MASVGHEVLGVDIDPSRVGLLSSGRAWFHEPGLDDLLAENIGAGRLRFSTSFAEAADFANVHFIGVATPGGEDGSYDLSQLYGALASLVPHLRCDSVIIGKSTVPPGTAAELQVMADAMRTADGVVEIVWNPEFLREGYAVEDTLRPDRIVVGAVSATAAEVVQEVYRPLTNVGVPLIFTDLATSELVKGAANAFLATKISFINAMADVCAATSGDVSALAKALGMDPRIGPAFLRAGLGYGGACLPKDVRGLAAFAERIGARNAVGLLGAVDAVNSARSGQVVDMARTACGELTDKRIAIWGAAFKPGTDDVRDSTALRVAARLHKLGAEVTVYDPMAVGNALVAFPEFAYADSALDAAAHADAIVIVTAWPEFAAASPAHVGLQVANAVVVDACQGINAHAWRKAGWQVFALTGPSPEQLQNEITPSCSLPLHGAMTAQAEGESCSGLW